MMAEEKKEMRKPGRLYDHPASKKAAGESPTKKPADDAEESSEAKAEAGEDKGLATVKSGMDSVLEGYKAIMAAHESERNDMNGNHIAERKAMMKRHEGAMKDYLGSQGLVGAGEQGSQTVDESEE